MLLIARFANESVNVFRYCATCIRASTSCGKDRSDPLREFVRLDRLELRGITSENLFGIGRGWLRLKAILCRDVVPTILKDVLRINEIYRISQFYHQDTVIFPAE